MEIYDFANNELTFSLVHQITKFQFYKWQDTINSYSDELIREKQFVIHTGENKNGNDNGMAIGTSY